ncbi:unnamed protein product [Brassica oleracea var. botrytis]|uniref:Transmembrane protein n=2 Tax=Brassica TaxID=3705 RepID=A0A3P6FQF9_BRAOL|nr:unnamed protein product [Brassica napus]CDY40136.1 BnaC06g05530D [Brassica napus]VDD60443.1 unnamed protein product [Brassica oleracea]
MGFFKHVSAYVIFHFFSFLFLFFSFLSHLFSFVFLWFLSGRRLDFSTKVSPPFNRRILRSIGVSSVQSPLLRSIGVTSDQSPLLRSIVSPPVNRLSFLSHLLLSIAKGSISPLQSPSCPSLSSLVFSVAQSPRDFPIV